MHMTDEGIALIKQWEGFRAHAYRDPVGILTIGYGHTSMAGAPRVHDAMQVTESEADAMLRRDVNAVAQDVARALRCNVSPQQFSALVSFCYNVGAENFRKSSVLDAVNRHDLQSVPRRLALWTKAGGRILPGLVKRRAAEAAMFIGGSDGNHIRTEHAVEGKNPARSTSIIAAVLITLLSTLQAIVGDAAGIVTVLLLLAIFAAVAWIITQRLAKIYKDAI
jgi:lysozyme